MEELLLSELKKTGPAFHLFAKVNWLMTFICTADDRTLAGMSHGTGVG